MVSRIRSVKGTRDLLPPETAVWAAVEETARREAIEAVQQAQQVSKKETMGQLMQLNASVAAAQETLTQALGLAGLEVTAIEAEITDLRRLSLNPLMYAILVLLFFVSRGFGLENRIFVMAESDRDTAMDSDAND